MAALKPELRKDLERVIIKARNLVAADVTDRLKELKVHTANRLAIFAMHSPRPSKSID
jgi:hypothetical protein